MSWNLTKSEFVLFWLLACIPALSVVQLSRLTTPLDHSSIRLSARLSVRKDGLA
jgi:hypothetical protein